MQTLVVSSQSMLFSSSPLFFPSYSCLVTADRVSITRAIVVGVIFRVVMLRYIKVFGYFSM